MNQTFEGWEAVAGRLCDRADGQERTARDRGEPATRLNPGQRASLRALASRLANNGVVIADEVGMGKTRIAVEVVRCVTECGGRVAILVPPGLGYQWHAELRDGGLTEVPTILRSLAGYLSVWDPEEPERQQPWFRQPAVILSHAFTNWRLGEKAANWRWALLPELYARWREARHDRLPNNYHEHERLDYCRPYHAAISIAAAVPRNRRHPVCELLDELLEKVQWPRPLDPAAYSKYAHLREWLEVAVGAGLGLFDLVVIDEAHKSRGSESGLSRLLGNVVLASPGVRRLALTATPVELDVSQWHHTLGRLGLPDKTLATVREVTAEYAAAVRRVRQSWRSNPEARAAYELAARRFRETLSPFLIRRDKREDPDVARFREYTRLPLNEYRREAEIEVKSADLTPTWREAICAAEALSVVTRQATDPVAKRLRLTLGNGHGIATLLDQTKRDEVEDQQDPTDEVNCGAVPEPPSRGAETKRRERAEWWLGAIQRAFGAGDESLFNHPAIRAAVESIERETESGGKVLVFGRFTRPLRALVELLNAREMLRWVQRGAPWPQSRVHRDTDGTEWPAVRAAHRQLGEPVPLETLDDALKSGYERWRRDRDRFRDRLVSRIETGFAQEDPGPHVRALFAAFTRSARARSGAAADEHPLTVLARALLELVGTPEAEAAECATAFCQLVEATSDREHGELDPDEEPDEGEAGEHWDVVEERLREEYNRTRGGFARLMFGGTAPESRRMIQLAFNRPASFPRVLVAQSLVGREGLNLHRACRVVVLLHPEWNPGVVEQQIGRVDRVDSRWCQELRRAVTERAPAERVPRIEVRPVVFRGTYDEHNWAVLRARWDDLRAQLHGIVIPPDAAGVEPTTPCCSTRFSRPRPAFPRPVPGRRDWPA